MEDIDPKYQKLADTVDIFHGLRASDVRKIYSRGMTMTVQKGDTLFHKGTVGNQMFVVLGGKMGVFDGPLQVATLHLGDTIGEMSLLRNEPRSATVRALERSQLFALTDNIFQKLLTKRVAVQMLLNISRTLAKRLEDANHALREMEGR